MTDTNNAYAEAIVALATAEGALQAVQDELVTVAQTIDANNDLREKLVDIHLPLGNRLAFVETAALKVAHPATRTALAMVIAAGYASELTEIATTVATLAAAARNRDLAEVTVAAPLDDARREQLRVALEARTGKHLDLQVVVDPSLLGGVRVRIGDTVMDDSLARRIDAVKARLEG